MENQKMKIGLGLLATLAFFACGKRQIGQIDTPEASQYAYFPSEIGKYRVYQVDSITYDFAEGGGIRVENSSTYVQEQITDTIRDNLGNVLYKVERSERQTPDQPWVLKQINTETRINNQAIRTENNFRFLALVFPMDKRSAWDGNLWIDKNREIEIFGERMRPFNNWAYEVDSIDVPAIVGAFSFDSTLVITEADDNNVIERRYSRVRYAKGIGVVWREQWILDSQYCNDTPVPPDCETKPWEEKAEKGYILRQKIIAFN